MEAQEQLLEYFQVFKSSEIAVRMMEQDGYSPLQVRDAIHELEVTEDIDPSAAYELTKALNMNSRGMPRENPSNDIVDEKEGVFRAIFGKAKKNRNSHVGGELGMATVRRDRGHVLRVKCPVTGQFTHSCAKCALAKTIGGKSVECSAKKGEEYYLLADGPMPKGDGHEWNAYVASPEEIRRGGRKFIKMIARDGD